MKATFMKDRVPLEDDYEVLRARTSSLRGPGGLPTESQSLPLKFATWTVGQSWAPEDDPELSLDPDDSWYDEEMEAQIGTRLDEPSSDATRLSTDKTKKKKNKRSEASARPHVYWKKHHRESYLHELLRWEGRGDFRHDERCPDCLSRRREEPNKASFRCLDCFLPDLVCSDCCIRRHQLNPLHIIEKWTGSTFVKTSLESIGLVIHLNHAGLRCPLPAPVDQRFRVLHTNGFHKVAFAYCACSREIPQHLQLLRRGFYPGSQQSVRTVVSFSLLRLVHALALASKIGTYDVYRALDSLTAGSAINPQKPRYRPLMRALMQWRHLKLLKRGGRGHDPTGAAGTSNGELALVCPSCPIPDVNLDEGWMEAPGDKSYLYQPKLSMDANFRLKNSLVSNFSTDPGLGIGYGYMLPREEYEAYVFSQADEDDISTCVGFQALAKATTRNSKGLRYTGVGMVSCARSEMVLPNGVGNLQKGERYANMDYIFAFVVYSTHVLSIAISYDIACQWFINLFVRMRMWPSHLRLRPGLFLRPLIPKFHEPAHTDKDHEQYSFNLAEGVGLTDGEAPERIWAPHNALANSTKSMGPGSMHDVYDDNFGYWNWLKYTGMGTTLLRRFKDAVQERNKQSEAHRGFTQSLPEDLVDEWEAMCIAWNADSFPKTAPNPFHTAGADISEDDAEAELHAEELRSRDELGKPVLHKTSPVEFLIMGLAIEHDQRDLAAEAMKQSQIPANLQSLDVANHRAALTTRIQEWELIRMVYMPGLLQFLTDKGEYPGSWWDSSNPLPETVALWLPSHINAQHRRTVCVPGLADMELKLRIAQCTSSLEGIRHVLRLKTRMVYFKNKNIRGQRDGTRSRSIIDRVHERARRLVHKYRIARQARLALEGPGAWEQVHRELRNEDVRSYSSGLKKKGPGRKGIWEDGYGPSQKEDGDVQMTSSDESDIDFDPGVRLTRDQMLKARKKGTGETRKEISWIWISAALPVDGSDSSNDILRAEWARSRARSGRAHEEVELLTEEMRRVLRTLDWRADWWEKRKKLSRSMKVTEDVLEGLVSYAADQAAIQRELRASFELLWKTPLSRVDKVTARPVQLSAVDESAEVEGTAHGEEGDEGEESDSEDEGEDVRQHGAHKPTTANPPAVSSTGISNPAAHSIKSDDSASSSGPPDNSSSSEDDADEEGHTYVQPDGSNSSRHQDNSDGDGDDDYHTNTESSGSDDE